MSLLVNFFAGPGAGKSTMASQVFSELKWVGVNCELASEYAKDLVWEGRLDALDNQVYVLGKQLHRIKRLEGQVDVILCDSPLLMSVFYAPDWLRDTGFLELCKELHFKFNTLNFTVTRIKPYRSKGRIQSEDQAMALDVYIKDYLTDNGIKYHTVPGTRSGGYAATELVWDALDGCHNDDVFDWSTCKMDAYSEQMAVTRARKGLCDC